MIDTSKTILLALVIISITSVTLTVILENDSKINLDDSIIEPIEKQVEDIVESTVPLILDEPETFIITESLKGFDSVQGELLLLTIDYWIMYDAPNRSSDLFELTLSFFDETTNQYVNFEFLYEEVTEDGILTAYSPDFDVQVVMYYVPSYDDSKIVIMHIVGDNDMENTLYFLTTPIFLVESEVEPIEDKEIIAGFTADELIEMGKILLPLLI